MLDRFRSMEVFVAAVDAGSFAAAAQRLDMTPQMVARYVQTLEARLQATLLQRTTRRQHLTELGEAYYQRCVQLLQDAAAADALAQEALQAPSGQLRISAPYQWGSLTLADFAAGFMQRYPQVQIDLRLSDQVVDLLGDGLELAFRTGATQLGESSSLISRPLQPFQMVACAAPAYLARVAAPQHPADLAQHPCIGFVFWNRQLFNEWTFTQADTTAAVRVHCPFQANSGYAQLRAALQGTGIFLAATDLVQPELDAGRLVRVLPDWQGPSRPMHLIYAADRQRTAKVRRFVDEALQAFGQLPASR